MATLSSAELSANALNPMATLFPPVPLDPEIALCPMATLLFPTVPAVLKV